MKGLSGLTICAFILVTVALGQDAATGSGNARDPIQGKSQTEVVDEVWRIATQGGLLTAEGWSKACGFFTTPVPFPGDKEFLIVSNDWGPAYDFKKGEGTDIELGYIDRGKIDSALRYTPPPKIEFIKTAFQYYLTTVPAYMMMYGPDGKTLVEKKPVGYRVWQIKGSPGTPWTTVNTAIRYVLEKRAATSDPVIKRNADATLAQLLTLH
jgi:hypothetical protein